MNIKEYNLKITLKTPLMHFGDELSGTMQTMRRNKYEVNGEFIDIPVFSGNALRGIFRTLVMRDFLDRLGLGINCISQNTFYTLFNGGSLKSGGIEDLSFKKMIKRNCPPLILLGSAYGNQMTEGKMKCDILTPICQEMNSYNVNQSEKSIYSGMLSEVFHTRMDRLKAETEEVLDVETTEKQTVQMKYEAETLSAGTQLEATLTVNFANELELSCFEHMINLLKKSGRIGGKSSAGYGKMKLECEELKENGIIYVKFIEENKEEIKSFIQYLESVLN